MVVIMRKFYNSEKVAGEMATRSLSDKAAEFYNGTDPLDVFEYEENGAKLYAYSGAFGERDGMTFEELESDFEEMYKMPFEDFQKEALAENGVQNDSSAVWVEVGGFQYSIGIDEVLDHKEAEPFEASSFLGDNLDADAWEDLYQKYLDEDGIEL